MSTPIPLPACMHAAVKPSSPGQISLHTTPGQRTSHLHLKPIVHTATPYSHEAGACTATHCSDAADAAGALWRQDRRSPRHPGDQQACAGPPVWEFPLTASAALPTVPPGSHAGVLRCHMPCAVPVLASPAIVLQGADLTEQRLAMAACQCGCRQQHPRLRCSSDSFQCSQTCASLCADKGPARRLVGRPEHASGLWPRPVAHAPKLQCSSLSPAQLSTG